MGFIKRIIEVPFRWSRALYDWVLAWGNSPHGGIALFVLSAAEASFSPCHPMRYL